MFKYLPSFFKTSYDGGPNSGVSGFWLIEWKMVFSLVFLKFNKGTREAYHNHAFSALTFWIWGGPVTEHHIDGTKIDWYPSLFPKYTPKTCFHKIETHNDTYAFCIRGPWDETWKEYREIDDLFIKFGHGREIIEMEPLLDVEDILHC